MSFVHLNTRSDYSFLVSTVTPEKLIEQALNYQMPGIALTDVGNLHGAMEFFSLAQKLSLLNDSKNKTESRLNPIIGMTVHVAPSQNQSNQKKFFQLILIAETLEGYRNLCGLSTASYNRDIPHSSDVDQVYYGKPYTTIEEIIQYAPGCLVLTAGAQGELFELILKGYHTQAKELLGVLTDGFGRDQVFVEIQNHHYEEERVVNNVLPEIATQSGLSLLATNQVCYLHDGDRLSWDIFFSIGEKRTLDIENESHRIKPGQIQALPGTGYHLRSPQEMEMAFSHIPEALHNTLLINERCRVDIVEKDRHMPLFPLEGKSSEEYLREKCYFRLEEKGLTKIEYRYRLDYELSVIEKMHFASYFIIVADLIDYARSQGIMVGAGRGSAAGSLISYVMGITSLDPITYGLYFERFLNPERLSFPDIDIDFQDDRRDEVIEYVRQHYGQNQVAQIVSFSKLKSKAIFKDVARVLKVDFETANKISKLIKIKLADFEEEKRGWASYLEFNYRHNNDFASIINSNPIFQVIYEQSLKLENLTRQTGIHAAGVVIADKPLVKYIPLMKSNDEGWVTQFDGGFLESHCGLLKIDFLGITTLTVLQKCVEDIRRLQGKEIDISHPPLDNKKTFAIFSKGLTAGIFQFESEGMTAYLKDLMPENIKELTAMNALYRPGPMAWIPVYIAKKHNRTPEFSNEKTKNDFYRLEDICKRDEPLSQVLCETRGIPFYQEQIMEICKIYAGFTLGAADNVRKAMGKKDKNLIQKLRDDFIKGAVGEGHASEDAEFLYDEIIIPFAGYGFNKSHSACYAYLAYQTAFLKANYPISFITSLFNSELSKGDSQKAIYKYLNECFAMDIEVYPPDINYSDVYFTSQTTHIIYGLVGIKNIGDTVAEVIVQERKAHGEYRDPIDFLLRHSSDKIGKMTLEALIKAGCFDFTGYSSDRWFSIIGEIQERLERQRDQRHSGQLDLFEEVGIDSNEDIYVKIKNLPTNKAYATRLEKEILGFNLRYEPTFLYRQQIVQATTLDLTQSVLEDRKGYLGCVIREVVLFKDRTGKDMAKLTVSDGRKNFSVICFGNSWEKIKQSFAHEIQNKENSELMSWLADKPVRLKLWIRGRRDHPGQVDLILDGIDFLNVHKSQDIPKTVWIKLISNQSYEESNLIELKELIEKYPPGPCSIKLIMSDESGDKAITLKKKVNITPNLKLAITKFDVVERVNILEESYLMD